MKELYLAGQHKVLLAAFTNYRGIEEVTPGRAVSKEGVQISGARLVYNPKKIDLCGILERYFEDVNPYQVLENSEEQAAVFYTSQEDVVQLEYYARFLQSRGMEPRAALGNMILNDSFAEEHINPPLQMRFGRLQEFVAVEVND